MPPTVDYDKINALFAEHVMGWLAVGIREVYQSSTNGYTKIWQGVPTRADTLRDVPRYTRSLEESFKAFEKYPELTIRIRRVAMKWDCRIEHDVVNGRAVTDTGKTPELAIVRALLMWVGQAQPMEE